MRFLPVRPGASRRTRRRLLAAVLALLAGLGTFGPAAAPASGATRTGEYRTVHAHRWGPIRFGDTLQEARRKGADIRFDRRQHTWSAHGCGLAAVRAERRTVGWVMVWKVDGREVLQRVSFAQGDWFSAVTATGVSIGMTERALLSRADRYDWDVTVQQHPYGSRGDRKITHRVRSGRASYAYVYDTFRGNDGTRRVVVMYAGKRTAARSVDGCFS